MQYTENLQLAKYESNDVTSYLEVANANMTKIDAGYGTLNTQVDANTSAIGDVEEDVNNMAPQVADANTKANAGLSNIASVYDATQTYAIGDYTLYNNNLYRCEVPIPQAESFDGTKWVRVKTTDEIKAFNGKITQINVNLTEINSNLSKRVLNPTTRTVLLDYEVTSPSASRNLTIPEDGYYEMQLINDGDAYANATIRINNISVFALGTAGQISHTNIVNTLFFTKGTVLNVTCYHSKAIVARLS